MAFAPIADLGGKHRLDAMDLRGDVRGGQPGDLTDGRCIDVLEVEQHHFAVHRTKPVHQCQDALQVHAALHPLHAAPLVGNELRGLVVHAAPVHLTHAMTDMGRADVVGDGLLLAQGRLETMGLEVRVDTEPSQLPSNTVLSSNPASGQLVHTGDLVRLTIAAPGPATQLLLPYDLRGITVVLDPAPVNDALGDVPLDIARLVRSLVQASHGVVRTTRALADTSTLEAAPARAQRAANGVSTVAVGLSASNVGSGGLIVFSPSPVLPHASESAKLASQLASDLALEAGAVSS